MSEFDRLARLTHPAVVSKIRQVDRLNLEWAESEHTIEHLVAEGSMTRADADHVLTSLAGSYTARKDAIMREVFG